MIHTDDIFLGAFALARGGFLRGVDVRGRGGRPVAYFRIEGREVKETEHDYYHGEAVVNLQLLKAAVRRLKDEALAAIRQEERRGHAHWDQPGRDRGHQGADGSGRSPR